MRRQIVMVALAGASMAAQAGEVYGGIGLPGLMLGYAHAYSPTLTARVDVATLGSRDYSTTRDGVAYTGSLKAHRAGVFGDWFVLSGGLRLTGGITFNTLSAAVAAVGAGKVLQLGDANTPYTLTADDRLDLAIRFPKTTPYIGIGYGHHSGKGLGFVWDIGVSIGKPKVTARGSGTALSVAQAQTDIAAEAAKIQADLDKLAVIPQISLGISYKF